MMRYLIIIISAIFWFDAGAFDINSNSFQNNGNIPSKYTCDSSDVSPAFFWKDIPASTKCFVLICEDSDASFKPWTHWILLNIPGEEKELQENIIKEKILPNNAIQGINDFGKVGYNGPCPPPGEIHHYFFKLYALNTMLSFSPEKELTKKNVVEAMQGYILGETKIVGLYER